MPRAFWGCSRAWNYIFLPPPPSFLPRWRVQPQPVSSRARSTNMWLLPVSAGGLADGKWYTAARLRTKSLSLTRTHTKTHMHAHTTTPYFHLRRLRHAYLEFTSTCDSEPRGVFISFRRKYKWHKTSHKSNHSSLWRVFYCERRLNTSLWLTSIFPLWR